MPSIGAAFVGLAALAVAAAVLTAAVIECPPPDRIPGIAIGLAVFWSMVFGCATVAVATTSGALGVAGLLAAAFELCAAAAVWFSRSRRGSPGEDRGGGAALRWPRSPRGPSVPENYWERWEKEFSTTADGRPT